MKKQSKVTKNSYCGRYHGNGFKAIRTKEKMVDEAYRLAEQQLLAKAAQEKMEQLAKEQQDCPKEFTDVLVENFNEIKA